MCDQGDTVVIGIPCEQTGVKNIDVDRCIASIIMALNDGNVATLASCCGHGKRPGNIALADGRELVICPDYETGRLVDEAFPQISPHPCQSDAGQ